MDYSLLLGIETLEPNHQLSSDLIHSMKAPRLSRSTYTRDSVNLQDEEELVMNVRERMSRKHCFIQGNCIYHVAIIDYLQAWDFKKRTERCIKTNLLGKDGPTLSAIEPTQYAERFKNFCQNYVFNS